MLIISEERRSEGNCSLEFEGMGVRVECFFENGGVRSEERVIGNGVYYIEKDWDKIVGVS